MPNQEDNKKYKVLVNGDLVEEPLLLQHGDRILVGSHHYYLYVDPLVNFEEDYDWETAMKEANKDQMQMFQQSEAFDTKLKEMEEKIRKEQEAKEQELESNMAKLEAERIAYAEQVRDAQEGASKDDLIKLQ